MQQPGHGDASAPRTYEASQRAARTLGARLRDAARRAALCATWLVAIDLALAFGDKPPPAPAQLTGWLAALGLGAVGLAAPWLLYAALPLPGPTPGSPLVGVHGFFAARGERDADATAAGALLGAMLTLALVLGAAFPISRALIIDTARPHFAALLVMGAHLGLALVGLLLYPRLAALGAVLTRALARTPLALLVGTPLRALALLAFVAALAAGAAVYLYWSTLRFLPWRTIGCIAGALAGTSLSEWLLARASRRGRAVVGAVLTVLVVNAVIAVAALGELGTGARRGLLASLIGKHARRAALAVLDFDSDGYLSVLGDGDCQPFDASISPAAVDVPDNGRDENCDGQDAKRGAITARPRQDWPVPKTIPERPPIVLITIDAFAARHVRALGGARAITPELDALAAEGTLFTHCFAHGPSTRLSFPSIFTSRWDGQIKQKLVGKHPFPIDASEVMLAEVARDAGYDTTAVLSDGYFSPKRWGSLLQGFARVADGPIREGRGGKHNGSFVTDAAIEALDQASEDKPVFLWVHYYDAHSPHTQPQDLERFGTKTEDLYDAELALVDREVGRLLEAIEERLGDDAFVFVTGDHGIAFDAPRHGKLNYGYDLTTAVLHVPLIVRGPEVRAQRIEHVVSTMDIAPTISNLLRVQRRLPFEGASLIPELLEGVKERPSRLHHQFFIEERLWDDKPPLEIASLRTDRYNLVHDLRSGLFELYDYRADYYEKDDLSDSRAHSATLAELKRQLELFVYDFGTQRGQAPTRRARKPATKAASAAPGPAKVGAARSERTAR